jgi:hypothetical protein
LAPGESTPWHRDPYHRVTVVLSGDALTIEYRDGSPEERLSVRPGQVDWDEPTDRVHRGVNVGREPYEEIAVFFLDHADADPQPVSEDEDNSVLLIPAPERRGAMRDHAALIPLTFVGLCIVLVKVARVPEYWIPLMVGVGLILFGLLRRFIRRNT